MGQAVAVVCPAVSDRDLQWPPSQDDLARVAVVSLEGDGVRQLAQTLARARAVARTQDAIARTRRRRRVLMPASVAASLLMGSAMLSVWSTFAPAFTAVVTTSSEPALPNTQSADLPATSMRPTARSAPSASPRATVTRLSPPGVVSPESPEVPARLVTVAASTAREVPPETPMRGVTSSARREAAARPVPVPATAPVVTALSTTPVAGALAGAVSTADLRTVPAAPESAAPEAAPAAIAFALSASTVPARPPTDEPAIRDVLERYGTAYSRLDARAARAVWPAVDARALERAFDGLESQAIEFDRCDVRVDGTAARAACQGTSTWVPRVGERRPRREPREWTFRLEKTRDAQWRIASASMR